MEPYPVHALPFGFGTNVMYIYTRYINQKDIGIGWGLIRWLPQAPLSLSVLIQVLYVLLGYVTEGKYFRWLDIILVIFIGKCNLVCSSLHITLLTFMYHRSLLHHLSVH